MPGHGIQRCYKLHGYPSNFKTDRRQATAVQLEDENQSVGMSSDNISFTPSQYQQLLQLLGKERKGDQSQNSTVNTGQAQSQNVNKSANVAGKFCFISSFGSSWIVDSGATDHMCHDLSLFSHYTEVQGNSNFITIPNGSKVKVSHSGTVTLSSNITLKDVLYVPEFRFNLISIPKVCRDMNCHVIFTDYDCYIQSSSMIPQHLGSFKDGL